MGDLGRSILGTYSAQCEQLRSNCPITPIPQVGDLVFFAQANSPQSNHIGLIYKVTGSTIYTVEGETTGMAGLVDNGNCVATKSYSKINKRILSYGRPNYTQQSPADKVIDVAIQEVGYRSKRNNSQLNSKTGNAGPGNFTKYGAWIGTNGTIWSGSFICWCFSAAYDSTFKGVIGNDPKDINNLDQSSSAFVGQSSGNSSLASYVNRLAMNNRGPRSGRIECLTIHSAKKIGDIYDLAVMLNSSQKCYNYGIDNSGTIGLFADEINWTDSSNSSLNDMRSINIICMNETLEPDYTISKECYSALVKLCEDVCRRNFILGLKYTGNVDTDSVTFHDQFYPKSNCPGPYIENTVIPKLIEEVNSKLNVQFNAVTGQVITSARLATSQTDALKAQSTIAIKSIKPYIIQPNRAVFNLDYDKLKRLGVIGAMIDAGERYDVNHELVSFNPHTIYKQTIEANYSNVPHGYIYTTRAKTKAEVKEEAYWLYFIISKYPPKLGIWLHCMFKSSRETAQMLVDEWYQYFIKWGLKSKCGLYVTKIQADLIGWPKQCAYMPLWLKDELSDNVCPDEEILTPSFFKLNNLTNQSSDISAVLREDNSNLETDNTVTVSSDQIGKSLKDLKDQTTQQDDKAEREQTETMVVVFVPNEPQYTGTKSWIGRDSIRKQNDWAYRITHTDSAFSDSDGLLLIDGRYLVAVGGGISSTVGTYIDITLVNKTVIPCIVGYVLPDNIMDPVNHIFMTAGTAYSCSQFIVHNASGVLNPEIRRTGDCSYKTDDWMSPVSTFKVYTTNWFKSEQEVN